MLQYHKKEDKLLRYQWCKNPCPPHPKKEHQWEPVNTPISGQFNLDEDIFDVTPIQEDIPDDSTQSNVMTEAKDCILDETDDNVSVMLSSQESDEQLA